MRRDHGRVVNSPKSRAGVVFLVILGLGGSQAHAWSRALHEDAEVVERSELIVIGHLEDGSVKYERIVPEPGGGVAYVHHATLIITEGLKGNARPGKVPLIIYYGLFPARYDAERGESPGHLRRGQPGNPKDPIAIFDDSRHQLGRPFVTDAREDHLWFLRKRSGPYGREPGTGLYGIADPEDVQSLSLKRYFLAYLSDDPEAAVRREMATTPEIRTRAQHYLDHREVRRLKALADPAQRVEKLLPYFLNPSRRWCLRFEARDGIVVSGDVAGPLLVKPFHESKDAMTRGGIMRIWGQIKYGGCVEVLNALLREHDAFWAKQDLKKGWWSFEVGSALTRQRRDLYGEVLDAVIALGHIGDARAAEAIEMTRRRWRDIGFETPQILPACDEALRGFAKERARWGSDLIGNH